MVNIIPFRQVESLCEDNGDWPLDIDDLLRFSLQVAQGLDFLASRNVSDLVILGIYTLKGCSALW